MPTAMWPDCARRRHVAWPINPLLPVITATFAMVSSCILLAVRLTPARAMCSPDEMRRLTDRPGGVHRRSITTEDRPMTSTMARVAAGLLAAALGVGTASAADLTIGRATEQNSLDPQYSDLGNDVATAENMFESMTEY